MSELATPEGTNDDIFITFVPVLSQFYRVLTASSGMSFGAYNAHYASFVRQADNHT